MAVAEPIPLTEQQHLVLDGMSWDYYERTLEEIANRPMRVTFHHGSIEIMPPLAEHESAKGAIGALVELAALESNIAMRRLGSTTFRSEEKQAGLEPDACYYLRNEARVRGMKRFDPTRDPPPDLAIETDITSRSIPRQPIYAELGVPELWRYDGRRLTVLVLSDSGDYAATAASPAFPLLPIDRFELFIHRMESEEQNSVLREFRDWVKTLHSR